MTERLRRQVTVEFTADNAQAEAVLDAILCVADIVDPGHVDVVMGPVSALMDSPATEGSGRMKWLNDREYDIEATQ